jgi:hypothetical protein
MPLGMEIKDFVNIAIGIVVTVLFGYFFSYQGFRRKQIIYATSIQPLMPRRHEGPEELEVLYKGKPVQSFFRITIWLWNGGNETIAKADLKTKAPLCLEIFDEMQVLQSSVVYQTREANNATLKNGVVLFDFLNQGDGVVIDIYADRGKTVESPKDRRLVELVGEIIGAGEQPKFMHYGESWTFPGKAFAIGFGLMLIYFAVGGMIGIARLEELLSSYWNIAELVLDVVLLGLGLWIVGYAVWRMMTTHRMPDHLFMMGRPLERMHPAVAAAMHRDW